MNVNDDDAEATEHNWEEEDIEWGKRLFEQDTDWFTNVTLKHLLNDILHTDGNNDI